MTDTKLTVRVGIGVIVENKGKILVGKRKGFAAGYSIPGGHLEMGETFEFAAIREVLEEANLIIEKPKVFAITNNLETYKKTGKHYISVALYANKFFGELKIREPDKCEEWLWVNPRKLPEPHFDASKMGVECFLKKKLYVSK